MEKILILFIDLLESQILHFFNLMKAYLSKIAEV